MPPLARVFAVLASLAVLPAAWGLPAVLGFALLCGIALTLWLGRHWKSGPGEPTASSRAVLLATAVLAASIWSTPLVGYAIVVSFLLGLAAISAWFAARGRPLSAGEKTLLVALLIVAAAATAGPHLGPLMPRKAGNEALGLGGIWIGNELVRFPAWLSGTVDNLAFSRTALGALTLLAGLFLVGRAPRIFENAIGPRTFVAVVVLLILADWVSLAAFWNGSPNEAVDASSRGDAEEAQALERLSRKGVIFWEKRVLDRMSASWLAEDRLALAAAAAARLATLEGRSGLVLLRLAVALDGMGEASLAQALFLPEKVPDDKLATIDPPTPREAWALSEIWRQRNRIKEVVAVLKPFAMREAESETEGSEAVALQETIDLRYGDYSLYAGDRQTARRVAERFLMHAPDNFDALTLMGEIFYEERLTVDAFQTLYRAFVQRPRHSRITADLAAVYVVMRELTAAYPLQQYFVSHIHERNWRGKQGRKLFLPGEAYVQFDFLPGLAEIDLAAAGMPANAEWPRVEVRLNDEKLGEIDVADPEYRTYRFEAKLRRGPNRITVRFLNDFGGPEEDRNLMLGPVSIRPVFYAGEWR